jgi:phytoene desaturase
MKKKIIVIGSGFGGLAAACRLAARGNDVEIFEKRDKPGGRAYVYAINGFKFDGGPAVITAPFMLDNIFNAAGRRRENYFELIPLNPFYRFFNEDGRQFEFTANPKDMDDQINLWNPADLQGYRKFIEEPHPIFEKSFNDLEGRPFLHIWDMLRIIPALIHLKAYQSVNQYISRYFTDEFLKKVFSFHPLQTGGNPLDPAMDLLMNHFLENEWGIWYPRGGTGAIVDSLVNLLGELGGEINYNTEVSEILVEKRKAGGVRLVDGSIHRADAVISNVDAATTYVSLVDSPKRWWNSDNRYKKTKFSMSLFVVYFGTRRRYLDSHLTHHNIIFTGRDTPLLAGILNPKNLDRDFPLFLHMPSITDPAIAPPGCESFCLVIPVPNLDAGVDWNSMAHPLRDRIMVFLEENYLPDLRANIVAEHFLDPLHFKNTLNSYKGAAFSIRPLLFQSGWFRPHNRSEDIHNLYLVGAGTHPGTGLPGALNSALIVEKLIEEAK